MRQMQLDFDKINLFKFEKFYYVQYSAFKKQITGELKGNSNQPNAEVSQKSDSRDIAKDLGIAQNSTFMRSYKCIEGYLSKEIEDRGLF